MLRAKAQNGGRGQPGGTAWRALLQDTVRQERGQALVETVLSMVATVTLGLMVFELGMMTYAYSVISDAANEGVRYAVVHGSTNSTCSGPSTGCDATAAAVKSVVRTYLAYTLHSTSAMTVTVAYPDGSSDPLSLITVTVNYAYVPFVTYFGVGGTVQMSSQGRIVY